MTKALDAIRAILNPSGSPVGMSGGSAAMNGLLAKAKAAGSVTPEQIELAMAIDQVFLENTELRSRVYDLNRHVHALASWVVDAEKRLATEPTATT